MNTRSTPTSDLEHELRALVEQEATAGRVPAISLAVADPERILCAVAVGHADLAVGRRATTEDQHPWFSMTKIATAAAAMKLYADGRLDLDAPIGTYLADYRPHPKHGHPTTRQLLTHTAGLGNPIPVRWVRPEAQPADADLLRRIVSRHATPKRAVGDRASYSNVGYLLAADVIEAVTGGPVEEWVTRSVLEPLGMTATGFRYGTGPRAVGYARVPRGASPALRAVLPAGIVGERVGAYTSFRPFLVAGAGYGGLIGTAADAVRLAAAHAAAVGDRHPVLAHPHLDAMRTISASGKPFDHGIGWFRPPADATRSPAFVEHYGTGGGFWNAMRIYPEHRLAVVAMANTTARWGFDRLFTGILQRWLR